MSAAKQRRRIALIGAGQIGGSMANMIALRELGDAILLDVTGNVAKGKALDLNQMNAIASKTCSISGTNDYADIKDSDVVIITAGSPRKEGMTRADVLNINIGIIKEVAKKVAKHAPKAFVVVVTNPLDAIVQAFQKHSDMPQHMVVGMAGVLDSARFRYFLSQKLKVAASDVHALVIGAHSDHMVPLISHTTVGGIPLQHFLSSGVLTQSDLDQVIDQTRNGGINIIKLLGNGSAYYAPAMSAITMAESYLLDRKRLLSCSVHLNGEYGTKDLYIGAPVIIGKGGVEQIIQLQLSKDETKQLQASIASVRELQAQI